MRNKENYANNQVNLMINIFKMRII